MKKVWLLLGAIFLLASCGPSKESVQAEIDRANTCQQVADCKDLGSHCPFGCNVLVHQSQASAIQKLLDQYEKSTAQKCAYDCLAVKEIQCENQRCKAVYQQ